VPPINHEVHPEMAEAVHETIWLKSWNQILLHPQIK